LYKLKVNKFFVFKADIPTKKAKQIELAWLFQLLQLEGNCVSKPLAKTKIIITAVKIALVVFVVAKLVSRFFFSGAPHFKYFF